jgi:hypothetical protein
MTLLQKHKRKVLLGVAVVLACMAALGAWHTLDTVRHSTARILCVHNLKMLAMGLKAFAVEHNGRFPDRLSELSPKYLPNLECLICPETQAVCRRERGVPHPFPPNPDPDTIDKLSSYAYVPGHTTADPADTVIVYEKVDNHLGRGRSLLYLDGHAAWEPPKNWRNGPPNKNLPPGF